MPALRLVNSDESQSLGDERRPAAAPRAEAGPAPWRAIWIRGALALAGMVWLVTFVGFGAHVIRSETDSRKSDFGVHYRAGADMAARRNLYYLDAGVEKTFKSGPALALALTAIHWLPLQSARLVWYLGDTCLLAAFFLLSYRMLYPDGRWTNRRGWALAGTLGGAYGYVMQQMAAGQPTSLWVPLCLLACAYCREGKTGRGGLALSAAVCIKVVPLCFAPLLLRRCRARGVAAFAAGLAFLLALPAAWLGWDGMLALTWKWLEHFHGNIRPAMLYEFRNQSLLAVLYRMLSGDAHGLRWAKLDLPSIRAIWLLASCALAAAMYGWFATLLRGPSSLRRENAIPAMLLIYMTVANPLSWKFNFIALVFPFFFVLDSALEAPAKRRGQITLLALAVFLARVKPDLVGDTAYTAVQLIGGRLWGAIALAGAVGLAAYSANESEAAAATVDEHPNVLVFPTDRSATGEDRIRRAA